MNNAVRKLPKRERAIKKTYFVADTPNGPCREFMKHSYELIPSNGYVLIHYLGNETATCEFAHGNSKHHLDRQYTRTCPSVLQSIENECTLSTTAKVYRKNITNQTPTSHLPVLQAQNSQQVENIRNKKLKEQRISHDSLYNLHEIALDMPEFVHKIETYPDMLCVCGHKAILDEFDKVLLLHSPSPQLMSYDTTFQLGDFYVSVFTFRHTLFKESPIIPATFLIHERKFQYCHEQLFQETLKCVPGLNQTKHPLVSDEEKGILNAVTKKLPALTRLRCWNHIIYDVTRWLRAHGAPSQDVLEYTSDLRNLFHQQSLKEYQVLLDEMANKWSAPFHEYYHNNLHPEISSIGRWVLEDFRVYNPYSGVTSNQSEALNYVLKQLQEWRESPLDCMILALYYLQCYYLVEITRGQHGLGNYHLHSSFHGIFDEQPIPQMTVYPPEDIVQRIKGELVEKSKDEKHQQQDRALNPHLSREQRR